MKTPTALDLPQLDPLPAATQKYFASAGQTGHGAQRQVFLTLSASKLNASPACTTS